MLFYEPLMIIICAIKIQNTWRARYLSMNADIIIIVINIIPHLICISKIQFIYKLFTFCMNIIFTCTSMIQSEFKLKITWNNPVRSRIVFYMIFTSYKKYIIRSHITYASSWKKKEIERYGYNIINFQILKEKKN